MVSGHYKSGFGIFHVVCSNSGPRVCLANKDRPEHDNENAYLQLKSGQVHYRCYIQRCRHKSNVLGPYPVLLKEFIAAQGEARGGPKRVCVDLAVVDVKLEADEDKPKTRTVKEFKLHQPHPVLNSHYVGLAKPFLNTQYLKEDMYDDHIRIHVVESSCNTGKTTSVINYAKSKHLKILALAPLISQLCAHEEALTKNGEKVKRYDDSILNSTEIGSTTLDSVRRMVSYFRREEKNVQQYVLFLDEFHSIVQYLYSSDTLDQKRREVLKDVQWLIRSAKKVIVSDNTLCDHDFYFLESALNEEEKHADLNFHMNTFQTFKGVPAIRMSGREKVFQMIKLRFLAGVPMVVVCNTKSDAKYIRQRLLDEISDPDMQDKILIYTSDTGNNINIAKDVNKWYLCLVIYSPKISTGIDYHPDEPIDVFYIGRGEGTVCPATAVQMVTRTRKIKALYTCTDRMRTKPCYNSEEEMNADLDMLKQNSYSVGRKQHTMDQFLVLNELGDKTWSPAKLEDTYSDNKFSKGYRRFLWYDTIMRD